MWAGGGRVPRGSVVGMNSPTLYQRSALLAAGYTDRELRRWLREGDLTLLRRGNYVTGEPPEEEHARHLLLVRAAFAALGPGAVASHVSAAVLHGLPTWAVALDRAHITRHRRSGGRRDRLVHVRTARLDQDEVVQLDGRPVTSVARTVLDLARTVSFESAVVTADGALGAGAVDASELTDSVRRFDRWPGCPAARRAIAFADGRSESVGESRSRVAIAMAGLPDPVPQWRVRDSEGRQVGRVDFGWPERNVVAEFDGKIKYGRLVRPDRSAGDVVFEEKLREDDLRAQGLTVIRWTWPDLADFTPIARRLRRALS
jgi:predicted transcriptional regulator of viral defense system